MEEELGYKPIANLSEKECVQRSKMVMDIILYSMNKKGKKDSNLTPLRVELSRIIIKLSQITGFDDYHEIIEELEFYGEKRMRLFKLSEVNFCGQIKVKAD